jgi:CheY-like chemotaxis protein
MAANWDFILIDDSKLDTFITERVVKNSGLSLAIQSFLDAREALEYIKAKGIFNDGEKVVLVVDIQMPLMNGFEFIEAFEKLDPAITEQYIVNVLTSSTNENDLTRIRNYKCVKNLWNKPLTGKAVMDLTK